MSRLNRYAFSKYMALFAGYLLLAISGFFLMKYLTPYGMGLVNDSVGYIGGARNMLLGDGYSRLTGNFSTVPITNYPPLYSMTLALLGLSGADVIQAAWWLNTMLFCANTIVMAWSVYKMSSSLILGLAGGTIFLLSAPFLRTHAYAMSEPLYILLSFGCMLALAAYMESKKTRWLVISGSLAGLAYLTRYVGLALFLTAAVVFLLFLRDWRSRLKAGSVYLLSGLPFILAWTVRNFLVADNAANRVFAWHVIPFEKIREGVINFWGWLMPEYAKIIENHILIWLLVFIVLFILLVIGCVIAWQRWQKQPEGVQKFRFFAAWVFISQSIVYFFLLVFTMLFVDASPIFEDRILTPFMIGVLCSLLLIWQWVWNKDRWIYKALVIFSALFVAVSLGEDTLDLAKEYHRDGQGFASQTWRESGTLLAVSQLPKTTTLYSNKITALYLLAEHPAYILPSPINPATALPREGYEEDVAMIRKNILDGNGYMVIFFYQDLMENPDQRDWLSDLTMDLPIYFEANDGIIFGRN